jgi:hypothetical protein
MVVARNKLRKSHIYVPTGMWEPANLEKERVQQARRTYSYTLAMRKAEESVPVPASGITTSYALGQAPL